MLRVCFFLHTTALHSRYIPFIDGALQLHKLRLAHEQAAEDLQEVLLQAQQESPSKGNRGYTRGGLNSEKITDRCKKVGKAHHPDQAGTSSFSSPSSSFSTTTTTSRGEIQTGSSDIAETLKKREATCLALEREFFREVESLRPVLTISASLEASKEYTQYIYHALRYFGLHDDPLMRQLTGLVSRAGLRRRVGGVLLEERGEGSFSSRISTSSSASSSCSSFSGLSSNTKSTPSFPRTVKGIESRGREKSEEFSSLSSPSSSFCSPFRNGEEGTVTVFPTELPNPPQVGEVGDGRSGNALEYIKRRRPGALQIPAAHRGHWVLQEPEILITREERREDPW